MVTKATKKSDRLTHKRRLELASQANDNILAARKLYWEAIQAADRLGDREAYGAMQIVHTGMCHTSVSEYS